MITSRLVVTVQELVKELVKMYDNIKVIQW